MVFRVSEKRRGENPQRTANFNDVTLITFYPLLIKTLGERNIFYEERKSKCNEWELTPSVLRAGEGHGEHMPV